MQQIARFDQQLNYVPFRYRHRSRTNPKEQGDGKEAGRYSRGKGERFNPEKYLEERKVAMGIIEGRGRRVGNDEQEWIGAESHPIEQQETGEQKQKKELTYEAKQQRQMRNPKVQQRQMTWSPFEHQHFNDDLEANQVPRKSFKEQSSTEQYNKEIADLTHKISAEINSVFNESDLQEIKETILKNIQETQKNDLNFESVRQIVDNMEKISQEGFSSVSTEKQCEQLTNNIKTKGNIGFAHHQDMHLIQQPMEGIDKYKKKSPSSVEVQGKRSQSNPTYAHHKNVKEKVNFKTQIPRKTEQTPLKLQRLQQFMPEGKQRAQFVRSPKKAATFESIQQRMTQLLIQSQPTHLPTHVMANYPSPESDSKDEEPSQNKNVKITNIKEKKKERKVLANEWKKKMIQKTDKKVEMEPLLMQQQPSEPAVSQMLDKFSKQTPNEAMRLAKQAKSREKARESATLAATNPTNVGGYSTSKTAALGYNSKNAYASKIKKDKPIQDTHQISQKIEQYKQEIHSPIKIIQSRTQQQFQSASLCSISQYSAVRKAKEKSLHASSPSQTQQQKSQSQRPEQAFRQFQLSYIESSIQDNAQRNQNISSSKHQKYHYQSQSSKSPSYSQHQQARSSRVGSDYIFSHPASYVHENPSPLGNSSIIKSQDGDELLKMMVINTDMREISSLVIEDKEHQMEEEGQPFNHQFQGIIDSNQSEYSPGSQAYSMSSEEIRRQFQEKVGDFQLRDLLAMQRGQRKDNQDAGCLELQQINEDSQVVLQARETSEIQDVLFANPRNRDHPTPHASTLELKLDRLNSQTAQAQPSPLLLHRHLHPKSAIQRFQRSKHNSADCTKTPKTVRFNFSLSILKQSRLSNQLEERWRGRLDRNIPRFKTRINDFY